MITRTDRIHNPAAQPPTPSFGACNLAQLVDHIERDAHQISQPTLIIWGEEDTVMPIKNGYKLHEEILNSRFVVLKDCGHVPQEEKSELFCDLVTEFCRDKKGHISEKDGDKVRLEA